MASSRLALLGLVLLVPRGLGLPAPTPAPVPALPQTAPFGQETTQLEQDVPTNDPFNTAINGAPAGITTNVHPVSYAANGGFASQYMPAGPIAGDTYDYYESENEIDNPIVGQSSASDYNGLNNEAMAAISIEGTPAQVSSIAPDNSFIVIPSSCNNETTSQQTIKLFCAEKFADSKCADILIGQVADTIVRMPSNCGAGPYARIASFAEHEDQSVPSYLASMKPKDEPVYALTFDYNFTAIQFDATTQPVYIRTDYSNGEDWLSNSGTSPNAPLSKRDAGSVRRDSVRIRQRRDGRAIAHAKRGKAGTKHQERLLWEDPPASAHIARLMHARLAKRWWGSFVNWLSRLTTFQSTNHVALENEYASHTDLYSSSQQCTSAAGVTYTSSLDVSIDFHAVSPTSFNYYAYGTIVPPALDSAFVNFNTTPSAVLTLNVNGEAGASFTSSPQHITGYGLPGLYIPGLGKMGPYFDLYTLLEGGVQVTGNGQAQVTFTCPTYTISYGHDGSGVSTKTTGAGSGCSVYVSSSLGVAMSASLEAHLIPVASLGVSFLDGSLLEASIQLQSDLSASLSGNASVNAQGSSANPSYAYAVSSEVCVNVGAGIEIIGGLTGQALGIWGGRSEVVFAAGAASFVQTCYTPSSSARRKRDLAGVASAVVTDAPAPTSDVPFPGAKGRLPAPAVAHRPSALPAAATAALLPPIRGPTKSAAGKVDNRPGQEVGVVHPANGNLLPVGQGANETQGVVSALSLVAEAQLFALPGNLFCPALLPNQTGPGIVVDCPTVSSLFSGTCGTDVDSVERRLAKRARGVFANLCGSTTITVNEVAVPGLYFGPPVIPNLPNPAAGATNLYSYTIASSTTGPIDASKTYNKEHVYEFQTVRSVLDTISATYAGTGQTANAWCTTNLLTARNNVPQPGGGTATMSLAQAIANAVNQPVNVPSNLDSAINSLKKIIFGATQNSAKLSGPFRNDNAAEVAFIAYGALSGYLRDSRIQSALVSTNTLVAQTIEWFRANNYITDPANHGNITSYYLSTSRSTLQGRFANVANAKSVVSNAYSSFVAANPAPLPANIDRASASSAFAAVPTPTAPAGL